MKTDYKQRLITKPNAAIIFLIQNNNIMMQQTQTMMDSLKYLISQRRESNSQEAIAFSYFQQQAVFEFIKNVLILNYFLYNKVMTMIWFGLKPQQDNQINKKDFDLLLSVQEIEQIQDADQRLEAFPMVKLTLIDSDNNNYFVTFQDRNFTRGQIVKIRSVRYIEKDGQIVKNDYSNILKLSTFFYDFKHFQEVKYDIVEYLKTNYDFDQYIEDPSDQYRKFSLLKKIHSTNNTISSLADLLRYQANPQLFSSIRTQKFRLQCYVVDIHPKRLGQAIRKISYINKDINYPLDDYNDFKKHSELHRILEVQVVVKDTSIDLNQQIVQLVLIQEEKEKHHDFFKGVELLKIEEENVDEYQKNFSLIYERLFLYTNTSRTVDIVVQPMLFQGKIIFRIIDTQFLP